MKQKLLKPYRELSTCLSHAIVNHFGLQGIWSVYHINLVWFIFFCMTIQLTLTLITKHILFFLLKR